MTNYEVEKRWIAIIERLQLIILEKDKIITSLRGQVERQEETHREFIRMMGDPNAISPQWGFCAICGTGGTTYLIKGRKLCQTHTGEAGYVLIRETT